MAITLVFLFLVVVDVAVRSGEAEPKHLHHLMTKREIHETFGTEYVPEYDIVTVTMPGARRRREGDEGFYIKADLNETKAKFHFTPVKSNVGVNTPVWLAHSDENAFKGIRYDPVENAISNIGEFQMYQDADRFGALVVYTDPDGEAIIEGILTQHFAIKSLPKRLIGEPIKVGDGYLVISPIIQWKPLNDSDENEVTGHYIVFRSAPMAEGAEFVSVADRVKRQSYEEPKKRTNVPEVVYPEILLALDHEAIRRRTLTQALRFLIAFWNSVDMVYSVLRAPKIHLRMAGIIVAADDAATPYIEKDTNVDSMGYVSDHLPNVAKYFNEETARFPPQNYDFVVVMTRVILCKTLPDPCSPILGVAYYQGACKMDFPHQRDLFGLKGVAYVYYNFDFGGVRTFSHETAHLLGVDHDGSRGVTQYCSSTSGKLMSSTAAFSYEGLDWSKCSATAFRRFFELEKSECMDNVSPWLKPVSEILPGRWLSLDGQCRNTGFEKACKVPKIPICLAKGCKASGSDVCEINEISTLLGSTCGKGKFCNSQYSCVPNE